jgi:hypothetical protein
MQHVEMDKAGDDEKPVLYFSGEKKGLMLNKTNAKRITHLYGEESEDWIGKEIVLYPDMTDLRGEPVETIRVRGPIKKSTDRKPKAAEPEFDNERYPIRD